MDKLWTFGCSFTAEYDLIDGLHFPYQNYYDEYKKWRGGELPKIWVNILGEHINYKIMNCAIGGSSNYTILNQFSNVSHLIEKDDILIFGWTSLTRFTVVNVVENIFHNVLPMGSNNQNTNLSDNTINEILINRTHSLWSKEVESFIYLINNFCKSVGAEVYHWTSDDRIFNIENHFINNKQFIVVKDEEALNNLSNTNRHNLLNYMVSPKHYGDKFIAKISDETNGQIPDLHLGEYGHTFQAYLFFNHIKNNTDILKIKNINNEINLFWR